MKLSELDINESGRVLNVGINAVSRRKLLDMGFTPNTIVTVLQKAPFDDPLYIRLRDYCISIRKSDAREIIVERI